MGELQPDLFRSGAPLQSRSNQPNERGPFGCCCTLLHTRSVERREDRKSTTIEARVRRGDARSVSLACRSPFGVQQSCKASIKVVEILFSLFGAFLQLGSMSGHGLTKQAQSRTFCNPPPFLPLLFLPLRTGEFRVLQNSKILEEKKINKHTRF